MSVSENLARNLLSLRRQKRWSQQTLSSRAGLPRSTIAHMESGGGNPTLERLDAVAAALGVSVQELISRPRAEATLLRAADIPVEHHSGVALDQLLPEHLQGMELVRMRFPGGGKFVGTPHLRGTREYLYALSGELSVLLSGELFTLQTGDLLAFQGDQAHSYLNRTKRPATAISVVLPLAAGA